MSQEKMERYKAAKQNKEQIRKEAKRKKIFTITIWSVVGVLFLSLFVYLGVLSSNNKKAANQAAQASHRPYSMNLSNVYIPTAQQMLDEAQAKMDAFEVEDETAAETETAAN